MTTIVLQPHMATRLSVSAEREGVAALPAGSPGSTNALVGAVALLVHATSMATSSGQTAALAVLHHGVHDPVDGGVVADGVVSRVHKDDLVVLVGGILVHPVAVQHAQVLADATNTALGNRAEVALVLQSDNTLVLGLSVHNTLRVGSLASSTADSNAINDVTLLGLHSQSAGLVGASGVSNTADLRKLAVLPGANTEDVTHGVALLLSPELFKILVSTHDESMKDFMKSEKQNEWGTAESGITGGLSNSLYNLSTPLSPFTRSFTILFESHSNHGSPSRSLLPLLQEQAFHQVPLLPWSSW